MHPPLKEIFSDLVRLETELWDALEDALRAKHELLLSWFEPMQVIARTPNCRVHDIATALSITVGGTSKLVDRLEESAWCERRLNPLDNRSSVIVLTARGRRLLSAAEHTVSDELARLLGSAATPVELAQFAGTMRQLRTAILQQRAT